MSQRGMQLQAWSMWPTRIWHSTPLGRLLDPAPRSWAGFQIFFSATSFVSSLLYFSFLSLSVYFWLSQIIVPGWYTAVFIELVWVVVRRIETSLSLLGPRSHKCLQGCLCQSLFLKSGKEKDLKTLWNTFFLCVCVWSIHRPVNPEGQTPARMLRGRSEFFLGLLVLRSAQESCEVRWFVLSICLSTGFEMKMSTRSDLLAKVSHRGDGQSYCFPFLSSSLALYPTRHPRRRSAFLFPFHQLLLTLFSLTASARSTPLQVNCSLLKFIRPDFEREKKKLVPPLLSMSNACSCLTSADGCQTSQSRALCSAGVCLWSWWLIAMVCFCLGDLG